jgi:hypothetical protein
VSEWALLKDWIPALNTPLLIYLVWLVARLYTNHIPHLQESLDDINRRLSRIEGIKDGVALERMKGK